MKPLFSSLYCSTVLLFCILSSDLFAADWHVIPSAEVPVRRGQGTEYKIIAVIEDGTKVSFVEEKEDWAKIRLESGKEGWIPKRYLSNEKPLKNQIADLEQNKALLENKLEETDARLTELLQVHNLTEQELTACMAERDGTKADYQSLQQDTADVVETKEKLTATEKELSEMRIQLTDTQLENTALKKNSALIWFLAGSCVLLIGWFIGLLTGKKNKKRRSSLL